MPIPVEQQGEIDEITSQIAALFRAKRAILEQFESQEEKTERQRFLVQMMDTVCRLQDMDNRQLAWVFMQTEAYKQAARTEHEICTAVVYHLYPDFLEREEITYEEWGWHTPEGDFRYI